MRIKKIFLPLLFLCSCIFANNAMAQPEVVLVPAHVPICKSDITVKNLANLKRLGQYQYYKNELLSGINCSVDHHFWRQALLIKHTTDKRVSYIKYTNYGEERGSFKHSGYVISSVLVHKNELFIIK